MTEEWRDVVGYEGFYQVSSLGRVYGVPRKGKPSGGMMTTSVSTSDGYIYVALSTPTTGTRRRAVHILVAEAFLGLPPEGHEVSHEDGTRNNPRLDNLRYRTRKDNLSLTAVHGTKLLGENTNYAVLTDEQVREIKRAGAIPRHAVHGYSAIARRYGVDPETIACIFKGRTWSHIQ